MLLTGDVVVLSPHLDDAVFSLGGSIARGAAAGARIRIVTVFAGDPDSTAPAGWWDRRSGFDTEGAAARARRSEDETACRLVGATPVWLPFPDATYEREASDDQLWRAIEDLLDPAQLVLLPGAPLEHVDHLRLARIVLERRAGDPSLALYAEQPYAKRRARRTRTAAPTVPATVAELASGPVRWIRAPMDDRSRRLKLQAMFAYASQVPLFGRIRSTTAGRLALRSVVRYEEARGGEAVAPLGDAG